MVKLSLHLHQDSIKSYHNDFIDSLKVAVTSIDNFTSEFIQLI
uniref:Uncharacterized protein n=1 Tax=Anguilla anguilla TaxID=7936 RepID=A0A0E9QHI0_ANGAN